jgi:hypothetical protein
MYQLAPFGCAQEEALDDAVAAGRPVHLLVERGGKEVRSMA